jgi:hypothetical protein
MRVAQKRTGKVQSSRTLSTPAPIGGLNARDALAAMPPNDAVTLDNFFPTPTSVNLRNGYTNWVTGFSTHVESLMPYNKPNGTSSLYAAAGTAIYDATTQGAVGAAVVSGQTNARWQHVNYGTTGGQFLVAVNGADAPQMYNGTAWQAVTAVSAPIAITGVTASTFIHVNVYKNRLYFIPKDSLSVWYMPVNSLGGAAAQLDLTPLFRLGGYLMAMATWTIDSGTGVTEYAVFISSQGEVVLYSGSDPSSSTEWNIVATFRVGRPVGRRCFVKVGSDLIILGADGFYPLSRALLTDRSQSQDAISNKIVNLVSNDVQNYGSNFGWEAVLHPIGSKLIVNVPQAANATQYQYVQNTISGAWCRFTGWNANCFAVMGDSLYFGGNLGATANSAYVAKADTGYSDNGAYIFGEVKTAFQYFGKTGQLKHMKMVRPVFNTTGTMRAVIGIDMDFADNYPQGTPTFSGSAGTAWNVGAWDSFAWGDASAVKKDWQGVTGIGYAAALHMRIVNNQSYVQWQSIDYVFELGGVL